MCPQTITLPSTQAQTLPTGFFGANRKPSRALLCVRRLSPYHRLKRKRSRQVFGANCTPSRVQKPSFQKSINPPGTAVCLQTITLKPSTFKAQTLPQQGFHVFFTQIVNPPGRVCVFADYNPTIDPTVPSTAPRLNSKVQRGIHV